MDLVHVASYSDASVASLAVMKLEEAGIEMTVVDGWGHTAAVTRVWVAGEDYERALEVIEAHASAAAPGLMKVYWPYVRWVLVWPSIVLLFVIARMVFAVLRPEDASSGSLAFLLAGPLAGSVAAYLSAPRFKWPLTIAVLAMGLRVSWSI